MREEGSKIRTFHQVSRRWDAHGGMTDEPAINQNINTQPKRSRSHYRSSSTGDFILWRSTSGTENKYFQKLLGRNGCLHKSNNAPVQNKIKFFTKETVQTIIKELCQPVWKSASQSSHLIWLQQSSQVMWATQLLFLAQSSSPHL